jgi:hypothetical protein
MAMRKIMTWNLKKIIGKNSDNNLIDRIGFGPIFST